jgi:hypothetical protein
MDTTHEIIQPSTATPSPSEAEMDGEPYFAFHVGLARLRIPLSPMPIA